MNLAHYLTRMVDLHPDRTALVDPWGNLSYTEMDQRINSLAEFLRAQGLRQGEKVAALLPGCMDYAIAAFATWRLGGVFVPLNYRFAGSDLAYVLENADAQWVVGLESDLDRLRAVPGHIGLLLKEHGAPRTDLPADAHRLADVYAAHNGVQVDIAYVADGDDGLIMYTSGSTGRPKGVRQTHRGAAASAQMVASKYNFSPETRFLHTVPMFHVGGMQCSALPVLFSGGTVIFMPAWNAEQWLQTAMRHRATHGGQVITMLADMVSYMKSHPDLRPDLSAMQFCVFGGSAVPEALCQEFESCLGVKLVELYGQTEQTGLTVTYRFDEPRRPGSMGRPCTEVLEAKVVTLDGEEVLPGTEDVGELWVRGDVVTPGYWKGEALNEERFHEGWLRTRDMVRWDQDGYLYYIGRVDEMIITGGENVYPTKVEAAIALHPAVAIVAVVGVPSQRWGQEVVAAIVLRQSGVSETELTGFLRQTSQLASYELPKRYVVLDEIPKTGTGKVDRMSLARLVIRELEG